MSGFRQDWLRLREAADHRSRSDFRAAVEAADRARWTIVDLGCGAGSNCRYLMPRMQVPQTWVCIDDDVALLEALERDSPGFVVADSAIATRALDLAGDIGATLDGIFEQHGNGRLVTASALLDLVSEPWIAELAAACARADALAWFALTYDGRIELEPRLPEDAQLLALVNAHQRRDKGFGAALGPAAHAAACTAFARNGFDVLEARSDWRLTSEDSELQRQLVAGWIEAAREQANDHELLSAWSELRRSHIDTGVLAIRVGHSDLLAQPRRSA